jgi:hypothetical protein
MAKGSSGKMIYFVLYIVLIVELLIVITERDELEEIEHEVRDKMLGSIAQSYKQDVLLSITPKASSVGVQDTATIALIPIGLVADEEKRKVEFFVTLAQGSATPPGWPAGGTLDLMNGTDKFKLTKRDDGTGQLEGHFTNVAEYKFVAHLEVERQFPGYLPHYLLDYLKKMVGEHQRAVSPKEGFNVSVAGKGEVRRKGVEFIF